MRAIIRGGRRPVGRVRVSGAKNSATRLLAAALLSDEISEFTEFPTRLVDVGHKVRFCRSIGVKIDIDNDRERIRIDASSMNAEELNRSEYDIPIRTTYLLAAAQLARFGIARIPYPGGCPIGGGTSGGRGYDLHLLVWRSLGCEVEEKEAFIEVRGKRFVGGRIDFPISTVGGTENALICAAVASGTTRIYNAYITPEVRDLISFLRQMGADLEVYGTSHVVVHGLARSLSGSRMAVMPDRIEALTWIVYAVLAQGEVTIENVPFESMEVPLIHLKHAGIDLLRNSSAVQVTPDCLRSGAVQPFELACGAHPGVISDMQPLFVALALRGAGTSRVFDYRYPERIAFVDELAKLVGDQNLTAAPGKIIIQGPARFVPGEANSTDLRGSMAAVIAALCADGISTVNGVHMALRGYNDLERKLKALGADINIENENENAR
ncbi:UDP-N-acetylglucosamine 1-carboxyvinyltransferase [Geminicoccus roseus]|uniref:UDP-N-acetylglucosamine 1-carboxyvinyltransferase n=1 Tax=Geminicoccus roseus TaxID=404900 RepID=UPI000552BFCA|nr:UDP-N-acetylglucosamine 1-carboxyvinyltransferase [Geminicoccus roseus]